VDKNEQILEAVVKMNSKMSEINTRITEVHTEINAGIAELHTEVAELRTEMNTGMAEVHTEVAELRTEMNNEIAEVHSEMAELRTEMNTGLTEVHSEMAELHTEINGVKCETREMKSDIKDIQITLENVTNKNIMIIAEVHRDLSNKLDKALKIENEKETLLIRLTILENEVNRIKARLDEIA